MQKGVREEAATWTPPLWSFFKNNVQNQNKESKFAKF
jgi:hypothetical protein